MRKIKRQPSWVLIYIAAVIVLGALFALIVGGKVIIDSQKQTTMNAPVPRVISGKVIIQYDEATNKLIFIPVPTLAEAQHASAIHSYAPIGQRNEFSVADVYGIASRFIREKSFDDPSYRDTPDEMNLTALRTAIPPDEWKTRLKRAPKR